MVLEKTLESPLDFKEIIPINPKGNQSLMFIGRTDAEAIAPILWLPDAKCWLRKDSYWGRLKAGEEVLTEGGMVGWHLQLNGYEFEQAPGVGNDKEAWHAAVHRVTKSWAWLSKWITITTTQQQN